ncbi:Uncharacterized protein PECH_002222 [Penicillium ucsense]|uniref:Uncharacterized protein n=1 Tax=Penicillium ucsense TaxID=2839758 RepID=A0A8J8VX49_9EURO|nr:Uncharacterized protein PECM_001391 [Penicillium ucsense]KAF7731140.1 Uncharacterized protein PECH_002222 [Penicillium ucsense]
MLRLRQLFRSQPRSPLSHLGPRQPPHQPAAIRHVRFRRPWFRSFLGKAILYGTAFHLWSSFVLVRFDDDDTQEDKAASKPRPDTRTLQAAAATRNDALADEESGEDDSVFIPLTWSWMEEGDYYRASDPEWQEFVKISKDKKKLQELREELAALVLKTASDLMAPALGSPLTLTGYWLVHTFPSRAPPQYVRAGIELDDEGISLVTKPLDQDIGDRIHSAMNPIHVALAIKDAYYLVVRRQIARLLSSESQPDNDDLRGKFILSHGEPNTISTREQSSTDPSMSEQPSQNILPNTEPELHPSSIISSLQRLPLPDLGPGSDLQLASMAFRLRLDEYKREQGSRTPRRGTFFISGPVGVKGPDGYCRFEVRGEYDPATSAWRTVQMDLRDANPRKQKPARSV